MFSLEKFQEQSRLLQERIGDICRSCGRAPESVSLLPVTKTHPIEALQWAAAAGFSSVGENRVQEAVEKFLHRPEGLEIELIGHLQSNKTRQAVDVCTRIQTVDSLKLIRRLNQAASECGRQVAILLQFNTGEDPAKYGAACTEAEALAEAALMAESLRLEGLMTIAPLDPDPAVAQRAFARLRELRDTLARQLGHALPVLSMGMSGDMEAAIKEGSTQLRIGTALFGKRDQEH